MLNIRVGDLIYVGGIAHQSTKHKAYSLLDTSLDLSGPIWHLNDYTMINWLVVLFSLDLLVAKVLPLYTLGWSNPL